MYAIGLIDVGTVLWLSRVFKKQQHNVASGALTLYQAGFLCGRAG